jgi:predicted nicotinamide N-methyase
VTRPQPDAGFPFASRVQAHDHAHDHAHDRDLGPIAAEVVRLPWTGRPVRVERPTDADHLLDRVADDPEQNLPYWAEIWPSGIALADAIGRDPAALAGRRVLEVGCGVGITAVAALVAGAELTVCDYFPEALACCRATCAVNAGREPRALPVNWRTPDPAFSIDAGAPFPVVLAADVLYEQRDVEPLLGFVAAVVEPGGLFWLAEPGRPPARLWLEAVQDLGWRVETETHPGPWPDPKDNAAGVVVGLHRVRVVSRGVEESRSREGARGRPRPGRGVASTAQGGIPAV